MQASQGAPLRTMVARVSPDDIVIYANGALAAYLGVSKKQLLGSPLEVVAGRCRGEVATCFARPETGRTSNHLVTDDDGRVFEAKLYSDGGVLDIVLDEVTTADSIGREIRDSSGTPFDSLSEDELRTARHPERRYLTISHTQLRGLSQVTDRLAPMEVRLMVNSFVEEACDAVFAVGCTVGETSGDSVLGIYGAPRYFADHPLRAIRAACDQMHKTAQLHAGFYHQGKELPPCSCGIWTGDTLVGTLGNSVWQHYTAIGMPVDLAGKLCHLARPGEVLLPEHTLTHLLRQLPDGWKHVRAESEFEPDLSDFQWTGDEIAPVPEHLKKIVYLLGPGVDEDTDRTELYFDYLWSLKIPGRDQSVPILRVVRPAHIGDALELSDDNVVTTQVVQALGKYKLIEVVGTGGMGKVWRGVDRFGNAVAIKVLHSSEAVTEAQLKRFRREAEVMARLPHRNICRVYEMNEFDGIQYIAMEFIDGLALSDLLYEPSPGESTGKAPQAVDLRALIHSLRSVKSTSDGGPEGEEAPPRPKSTRIIPVEQTLTLILKVCEAVQFAHEHGVLHRDLKPGNIMLREDGEPLVADFGLAKLNTEDATHSLSMTGHVVGTLENMSPEQAESSKDVDERADVYSIGTILYQMLTGRRHFEATGNIVADAQALKHHEPVRLRALNPQIDSDLEIITLKALRNDPVERYRSVAALKADIEHYRRGEVISAKPVSLAELFKKLVQRNKAVSGAIAGILLVLIIGATLTIYFLNETIAAVREKNEALENKTLAEQQKSAVEKELRLQAEDAEMRAKASAAELAKSLEELQRMTASEQRAIDSAKTAAEQTASEKMRAEMLEKEQEILKKDTEQLQQKLADMQNAAPDGPAQPAADVSYHAFFQPRRENSEEASDAMREAMQQFNLGLAPMELQRLEKNPDEVLRRLTIAMDQVSRSLVAQPDFVPAWMLKGRLHLALMEYDYALEAFRRAVESAKEQNILRAEDDSSRMLEMAAAMNRSMGDKYLKGAEALRASDNPQNRATGLILQFLAEKSSLRKSSLSTSGPLGRKMAPGEVALALIARNGRETRVFIRPASTGGFHVIIWNAEYVRDLSPLKELDCTGLAIVGAKAVDWTTLVTLRLEFLDLSHCAIENLPQGNQDFVRIRTLNLSDTAVSSIGFARVMPHLEKLNVSSTNVTDLSPLQGIRSLRELDLGGLNPANLRVLMNLPIDRMTLSPMLITDKVSLNALRAHRTITVLRTPDDPEGQTPAEFWRKVDAGAYNASE